MSDVSADTVVATGASAVRALADRFADRYSIYDYADQVASGHTLGDGGDDHAALQAAINAAAGKASLHIPFGLNLNISTNLAIPSNSDIIIDGNISALTSYSATSAMIFFGESATGAPQNISVRGNGIVNGGGYDQNAVSGATGTFSNWYLGNLTFTNFTGGNVNWVVGSKALVEKCTFNNTGAGGNFTQITNGLVLNNRFVNNVTDDGFGCYGGCNDIIIQGNYFDNCLSGPYVLCDSGQSGPQSNIYILDNMTVNCLNAGIFTSCAVGSVTNLIIRGNIVSGGAGINTASAIAVEGTCNNVIVEGNTLIGPFGETGTSGTNYGIGFGGTIENMIVRGNIIGNLDNTNGILININDGGDTVIGIIVESNLLFDNTTNGTWTGIYCHNASDLTIRDNTYLGNIVQAFGGITPSIVEDSSSVNNAANIKIFSQIITTAGLITAAAGITGGNIDGTTIGATTPAAATFRGLTTTGATTLYTVAIGVPATAAAERLIDFYSSGNSGVYNSRIFATGGSETAGTGQLAVQAGLFWIAGPWVCNAYTVATLPANPTIGYRAYVSDASSPAYMQPVVGGGSTDCPVFYSHSQGKWLVG